MLTDIEQNIRRQKVDNINIKKVLYELLKLPLAITLNYYIPLEHDTLRTIPASLK